MKRLFLNDRFILFLIVLNTIIIFLSGFNFHPKLLFILSTADYCITILFVLELIVKLRVFKREYFKSGWNKFDFILIILSVPSLIALIFHSHLDFGILLIFRVLRVFKAIRFIKFIPGIEGLMSGIVRALKSSVIAIFGFLMYAFIAGMLSFYLFRGISPEHFGDPFVSLYSMFKVFTVEGWNDVPEAITVGLSESISFLIHLYFMLILLTGGIIGLSLVNSIFVDAMVSDNNDALEEKVDKLEEKIDLLLKQK